MPHSSKDGDTAVKATHSKGAAAVELALATTAAADTTLSYADRLAALKRKARATEAKVQADRRAAEFGA